MPLFDKTIPSKLQTYVSNYLADTFMYTLLKEEGLQGWLNASMINPNSSFQLNTTSLNKYLPGIKIFYGPNKPVDFEVKIDSIDRFSSCADTQTMSFYASAEINMYVEKTPTTLAKAMTINLDDFYFNFTLIISNMTMQFNITEAHLLSMRAQAVFGTLNLTLVTNMINDAFIEGIPIVNKMI